jgi:glycine/D-amino acid oxidase-like deaminating enzyme
MESIWHKGAHLPSFPSLNKDISTDVLIIGGGIAGLLIAYLLEKEGIDYILVEKDKICSGVTQNTTAKITFQHGLNYQKLISGAGVEIARKYLEINKKAFDEYKNLCKDIKCDFEIKDNFVYFLNDRKKFEKEMSALEKIGYNAEFFEDLSLPFKVAGGVRFKNQAQFNPLKFLSKIAKDLKIYENTFVREMIGTTAVTDKGKISAKKVIVATHFPFINKHGSYFLKLYQHRSYILALENGPKLKGMYVDENKKGLSFRNYKDFLLLGGGGHRTGKKGGCWQELRDFARIHYPLSKEKFYWAAQDCMSVDDVPYIGNYSKNTPNLYVASGFNKWGMTGSMVSALLIRDMILEKDNDFYDVFNPSRSILKPQLFVNGFESTTNLLKISDKRCPHLGCALKWNSAEHSWDCPCHGSRFSKDGKVLDNPANGDLNI